MAQLDQRSCELRRRALFRFGDRLVKTEGVTTRSSTPSAQQGNILELTDAGGVLYFTYPDASGQGLVLYASNGTAGAPRSERLD